MNYWILMDFVHWLLFVSIFSGSWKGDTSPFACRSFHPIPLLTVNCCQSSLGTRTANYFAEWPLLIWAKPQASTAKLIWNINEYDIIGWQNFKYKLSIIPKNVNPLRCLEHCLGLKMGCPENLRTKWPCSIAFCMFTRGYPKAQSLMPKSQSFYVPILGAPLAAVVLPSALSILLRRNLDTGATKILVTWKKRYPLVMTNIAMV